MSGSTPDVRGLWSALSILIAASVATIAVVVIAMAVVDSVGA